MPLSGKQCQEVPCLGNDTLPLWALFGRRVRTCHVTGRALKQKIFSYNPHHHASGTLVPCFSQVPPPITTLIPPMSILAALTTVLFFSGSAVAQINYPSCIGHALWDWVCNTQRLGLIRPLRRSTTDRRVCVSRRPTRSIKIPVKSPHISNLHAHRAVSVSQVLPPCVV